MLFALFAALAAAQEGTRRVDVSSDEVEYSADGKSAVFRGNVVVSAEGLKLHAATLRVQSDDGGHTYIAQAGAASISLFCDDCAEYAIRGAVGSEVRFGDAPARLQLSGGVHLCADAQCARGEVQAASADWQKDKGQLHLRGAPLVYTTWLPQDTPQPLSVQAREVHYHFDSGEAKLSGAAQITRGESQISGDVIHVNVKTGALRAAAQPNQRVQATFGGEDG